MIALKTAGACGHCPLSLICYQGRHFGEFVGDIKHAYNFRFCRRCFAVIFDYCETHTTYICGLIRYGACPAVRKGTEHIHGWHQIMAQVKGARATKGCGSVYKQAHLLTDSRAKILSLSTSRPSNTPPAVRLVDRTTYDDRDCFDLFKDSISAIY